jgi:hypothetical protein
VQVSLGGPSGLVGTFTFATPTTLGELIVIMFIAPTNLAPLVVGDFSDGSTNVYQKAFDVGGINPTYFIEMGCWYVQNSAPGVTSISVQFESDSNTGDICGVATHYKGLVTSNVVDQIAAPAATSTAQTTPWASAPVTTLYPYELLLGFAYVHNAGSGTSLTLTGNWTQTVENFNGNGDPLAIAEIITTSIQSGIELTGTSTGSPAAYPGMVTFIGAGDVITEILQFNLH